MGGCSTYRPSHVPVQSILPDIEHMATSCQNTDDFSDLWRLDERPSTYLSGIITWRPTQIFPSSYESDSESDVSLDEGWMEGDVGTCSGQL